MLVAAICLRWCLSEDRWILTYRWEDHLYIGEKLELTLKIDDKGRILIPAFIRRKLNLKRVVKVRIEGGKLIIEPFKNPTEALTQTVIKGTVDVEKEIAELRKIAEKEGLKRVKKRWF